MSAVIENRIRRLLMLLAVVIYLGTLVELWLEEHTKETIQYLPFILCVVGIIAIAAVLVRPERARLLGLRVVMGIIAAGGLLGVFFHLYYNYTFILEISPNASASALLEKTFKGTNPLFAPGILVFASLMVLIATYYHPTLRKHEPD